MYTYNIYSRLRITRHVREPIKMSSYPEKKQCKSDFGSQKICRVIRSLLYSQRNLHIMCMYIPTLSQLAFFLHKFNLVDGKRFVGRNSQKPNSYRRIKLMYTIANLFTHFLKIEWGKLQQIVTKNKR